MNLSISACILIGDTHFGEKSFNLDFFENQLKVFKEQIVPYMIDNGIKYILQTGDLFHNRITMDINFFDKFCAEFIEYLAEKDITLITFLGNHDIYFKSTRNSNLSKYLEKMYSNVILFQEQDTILINDKKVLLVPWLLENESINYIDEEIIIGHFEIKSFMLSRGSFDEKSKLTSDLFSKYSNLKKVYSGHYHINQEKDLIHYVGTPYQINWGDFGNNCGFYHFNGVEAKFIENKSSYKHIKIIIDEKSEIPFKVLDGDNIVSTDKDVILDNCILKVFNKYSVNNSFEEFLFRLKEEKISYNFYNEQEIESIINPDNKVKLTNTDTFVLDYIKDNNPELLLLIESILENIKEEDA